MYYPPRFLSISDATWFGFIGMIIAAAAYAMIVVTIGFVVYLLSGGAIDWESVASGAVTVFLGLAFGVMIAAIAGLISFVLITTFNWSLGHIWHPITAAGIAGGMTGFLATCALPANALVHAPRPGIALLIFSGPVVAMFMGQIGAIRFATKAICSHYEHQGVKVDRLFAQDVKDNIFQFDVRQLFVLTAWFGVLFALLTALASVSWVPAALVIGYISIQLVTFQICTWMTRGWVKKRFSEHLINEPPLGPNEIKYGRMIERDSDPFSHDELPEPYKPSRHEIADER